MYGKKCRQFMENIEILIEEYLLRNVDDKNFKHNFIENSFLFLLQYITC